MIWLGALVGYLGASLYYKKLNRTELLPFLMYLMIASFMIGTHQVFEFLSLYTSSGVIYKVGLLISLSGIIFYLISVEKLYNRDLYVKYFWFVWVCVGIYLFLKPVTFSAFAFHLEHQSIFFWTLAWFIFFMYWIICIISEQKTVKKFIPKSLMWMYLLFSMTISFLVSVGYSLWNYYSHEVNICVTYPSIWCTFAVLQILVLPFFLYFLPIQMKVMPPKTKLPFKLFGTYLFIVMILAVTVISYLVLTGCFNIKFILQ